VDTRYTLSLSPDDGIIWQAVSALRSEMVHFQDGRIDWRVPVPANITAAARDSEGGVWFGNEEGIWQLNGRSLTLVARFPAELSGQEVQAVLRDRTGALWCSIEQRGAFRYTDGRWERNGGLTQLPNDRPLAMTSDAAGRIWLTYTLSVAMVDGNTTRVFGQADGVPERNITAIGTRGDHVWIGSEIGLHWFDGSRFVTLHVPNERALRGSWGIVETSSGDVWTAGEHGIARVTAGQIERARKSSGRLEEVVQLFGSADGMPGGVQALRPTPALIESGDGKLWVALAGGIGYFDPSAIVRDRIPPPVQISALLASGREYPLEEGNAVALTGASIELPPATTQLRILYTAHSLTAAERVHFRYRLEGLDKEWQDVGNRREANYTNVGPGKYRFRVIAANHDGVWNETGATLSFVVLPAFYQTSWFYGACILAAFVLLTVLYRLRLHQVTTAVRLRLEERIVERERIARELHDTLLQGVQGLILRFQAGTNRVAPEHPARTVLESALERADQVLIESRDRVKGLRDSALMQEDLPAALARVGEQLAQDSAVKFSLAVEGAPRSLHPILKEEVFLIVREALTNAFHHSGASNVEAEITFSHTELRLRVRDDGRGIPASVLEQGGEPGHWGLPGMRERAERIRGVLEIWSRDGAGTEVQLRIRASLAYREPGSRDVETLVT
jgi:signal transduction histidine kinase